ncbi:MAG: tetratricopeptide repeat protein, partial [Desulfobacterales bacterium]
VVYDKLDRKEDSMETMKKVIRVDPKNADALNYLGYSYADLGQNLDEAEKLIKEALKYKPDDGYVTDSLGWVYFKKGLFQKALKFLEKAIRLVPDDPVILEHLGDAYLKTGHRQKALQYYQQSLQKKKKDKKDIEKKIQDLKNSGI